MRLGAVFYADLSPRFKGFSSKVVVGRVRLYMADADVRSLHLCPTNILHSGSLTQIMVGLLSLGIFPGFQFAFTALVIK